MNEQEDPINKSVSALTSDAYESELQERLDRYVDGVQSPTPSEPSPVFEDLNDAWRRQLESRMQFFGIQKTLRTEDLKSKRTQTEAPAYSERVDDDLSRPSSPLSVSSVSTLPPYELIPNAEDNNPTAVALRKIIAGFESVPIADDDTGEKRLAVDTAIDAAKHLLDLYDKKYQETLIARSAMGHEKHHHTGDDGPAISELNEALSGLYWASTYASSIFKSGYAKAGYALDKKGDLLDKSVPKWAADAGSAQGVADVVTQLVLPPAVIVFAIKAISSGYQEYLHSKHTIEHIDHEIPELEKCIGTLKSLAGGLPADEVAKLPEGVQDLLKTEIVSKETVLKQLEFARARAEADKRIGMGTMAAGATVLAKTTLVATSKLANFVATKAGAAEAIAGTATFATGAGLANAALGPIAGAAAVYTGAKLYKNTKKRQEQLEEVMPKTLGFLGESLDAAEKEVPSKGKDDKRPVGQQDSLKNYSSLSNYNNFISTKLQQRLDFYKRSNKFNASLIGGGALYGATATTQGAFAITAAVTTGVAFLSNPITMGVLAGGLAVGGVWMGASAGHLITAGPKNQRYGASLTGDDKFFDRNFLTSLDAQAQLSPDIDPHIGVKTRAAMHDSLKECERLRQNILHNNGTGKQYKDLYIYSTDSQEVRDQRKAQKAGTGEGITSGRSSWMKQAKAHWSGSSIIARLKKPFVYVANLHKGRKVATEKAKKAYGKTASYLTKTHYAEHLKNPKTDHKAPDGLYDTLSKMMEAQADSLRKKIEAKQEVFSKISLSDTFKEAQEKEAALADDQSLEGQEARRQAKIEGATIFKNMLKEIDKELERDMMMYNQTMKLAATFQSFRQEGVTPLPKTLSGAIQEFMTLRRGEPYVETQAPPDVNKSWERLSEFLLVDERKLYRDRQTLLPDIENEATLKREAMARSLGQSVEIDKLSAQVTKNEHLSKDAESVQLKKLLHPDVLSYLRGKVGGDFNVELATDKTMITGKGLIGNIDDPSDKIFYIQKTNALKKRSEGPVYNNKKPTIVIASREQVQGHILKEGKPCTIKFNDTQDKSQGQKQDKRKSKGF